MEQSVPKRRYIKFRRRGFTQNKEYNKMNQLCKWTNKMHFYILIYSTVFMSTLHVSNDRVVHHQGLIVVYTFLAHFHPSTPHPTPPQPAKNQMCFRCLQSLQ